MNLTVKEIADLVGGQAKGCETHVITGAQGLEQASSKDISFLKQVKKEGTSPSLEASQAGAIFVPMGTVSNGKTVIEVENPVAAFARILEELQKEKETATPGIHPLASVDKGAKVGSGVSVGPFCVVEDGAELEDGVCLMGQVFIGRGTRIGKQTLIYPQVIIRENIRVGERCIFHPGVVIGSDGYGYYFAKGKHNKIPQIGTVVIEDEVEIGASSTVDRATTGATVIKKGTKIDNLVQVAHNVEIGENSLLAAQVGIAGSSKLGKGVVLAGQVGVADHVTIGDGAQVGAQSGIKDDVEKGSVMFGSPAQPIQETLRQSLLIRRLPELFRNMKKLKDKQD